MEKSVSVVAERKRQLRQAVKLQIQELDEGYCKKADERIFRRVISLPEYGQADTVFCFVGTHTEIDTVPILKDAWKRGKRVCVPKCIGKGMMNACQISGMDDLQVGSYGILEPGEDAQVILPGEIDLALVPCLSSSRDGKRLGYGGGYYDRYLSQVTALKAVLCRSRMMRESIPVDRYDVQMDMVICEAGILHEKDGR